MLITEVRVKLMDAGSSRNGSLLAFASITLDDEFVIRDLKVIEGKNGRFVAMPSRQITDHCWDPGCRQKNPVEARYCGKCGAKLADQRAEVDDQGRFKLNADVAHPIVPAAREKVQEAVLAAYDAEYERSLLPGYVPTWETGIVAVAAEAPLAAHVRAGVVA